MGLVLWYKWGLERKRKLPDAVNTIVLTNVECQKRGIGRRQKSTSLNLIEDAGLARVDRRDRRNLIVTLIVEEGAVMK